jgi:hypothetical protein
MEEAKQIWEVATRIRVRALSASDPVISLVLYEFANMCEEVACRIDHSSRSALPSAAPKVGTKTWPGNLRWATAIHVILSRFTCRHSIGGASSGVNI